MKRFRTGVFALYIVVALLLALVPRVLALFSGVPPTVTAAETTAKSDLRNIAVFQQDFHEDSGRYSPSVTPDQYRLSQKVTGPTIALTQDGFTARVGYAGTAMECAIFEGSVPSAPAVRPGVPACVGAPRRGTRGAYAYYVIPLLVVLLGWWRSTAFSIRPASA